MGKYDRSKVIENFYKASNALTEIDITENIPEDLKQLTINASSATVKIIDYINNEKDEVDDQFLKEYFSSIPKSTPKTFA